VVDNRKTKHRLAVRQNRLVPRDRPSTKQLSIDPVVYFVTTKHPAQ